MPDFYTPKREKLRAALDALLLSDGLPSEEALWELVLAASQVFRQGVALAPEEVRQIIHERWEAARLERIEE